MILDQLVKTMCPKPLELFLEPLKRSLSTGSASPSTQSPLYKPTLKKKSSVALVCYLVQTTAEHTSRPIDRPVQISGSEHVYVPDKPCYN